MPIEFTQLANKPEPLTKCPRCGVEPFVSDWGFRGTVQRSKRFLWVLWKRDLCTVICDNCGGIVGWESPPT